MKHNEINDDKDIREGEDIGNTKIGKVLALRKIFNKLPIFIFIIIIVVLFNSLCQ